MLRGGKSGLVNAELVGVVANPASGRDVRRLVSGASVFDNAEKARMVARFVAGMAITGERRILLMPATDGLPERIKRLVEDLERDLATGPLPEVEVLDTPVRGAAQDTVNAVRRMVERGVGAILVVGGDGTHRAVAKACGDVPLCTLSTGTNNAFPAMWEPTVAGIATGLVVAGHAGPAGLRVEKALRISREGEAKPDLALVDVAFCASRFVGARAVWRAEQIREIVVAFASPSALGISAIAARVAPVARYGAGGLYIRLGDPSDPRTTAQTVNAPLAPGLISSVAIESHRRFGEGDVIELGPGAGTISLDGEREIELAAGERVQVNLDAGPVTIDVDQVLAWPPNQSLVATRSYAAIERERYAR